MEQRADASAPTGVWGHEARKVEHRRAVVHMIGHLRHNTEEERMMMQLSAVTQERECAAASITLLLTHTNYLLRLKILN